MKVIKIGDVQTVMSNPDSKHNYFGWPTACRLQNGKIAVVASGFRLGHVCPFGKTVISYSEDEACTYTVPAPVIDTPLDDRDGGIVAFGKSSVIVTSFNNTAAFQRKSTQDPYYLSYIDTITEEDESKYLGVTYRISRDFGTTFGEIRKSPVSNPHGPIEMSSGELLWVGRPFDRTGGDFIQAYIQDKDEEFHYLGGIENVWNSKGEEATSCEPHSILLKDGSILTQIRVQKAGYYTIFQSKSSDGGRTWTKPRQILEDMGGVPPHLFRHSSGLLICTYGRILEPFGVGVMFSHDEGETWDIGHDLYVNPVSNDCGYPTTVELRDGSLVTVFYGTPSEGEQSIIMQQKWRFEDDEI
ncbi:MAG: exo-alpha-sialidase [Clostridia bacterium]|nr:exo-alpha-sialidase [Clostridia bacterium]